MPTTNVLKKLGIAAFSGDDTVDFHDWIRHYETLARCNNWSSADKLINLAACLTETPQRSYYTHTAALEVYKSQSKKERLVTHPEWYKADKTLTTEGKWHKLKAILCKEYEPRNALFHYVSMFMGLAQAPGERVQSFYNRVDTALARMSEIDDELHSAMNTLVKYKFVHGLQQDYHEHLVPVVQSLKLQETLNLARQKEDGLATKGPTNKLNATPQTTGLPPIAMAVTQDENRADKKRKNRYTGPPCTRCKRNNHPSNECFAKRDQDGVEIATPPAREPPTRKNKKQKVENNATSVEIQHLTALVKTLVEENAKIREIYTHNQGNE